MDMKGLKYVFAHTAWAPYAMQWHQGMVRRHRERGFDVESFCLIPRAPAPHYTFAQLERKWRRRDRDVVALREGLAEATSGRDVLICFNGANIHLEMVKAG